MPDINRHQRRSGKRYGRQQKQGKKQGAMKSHVRIIPAI
jgi:hypothetical protein